MGQTGISGIIAIVIASIIWGTTGTAAHFAPQVHPLAIGAFAMGGGGLLLCFSARVQLLQDLEKLRRHALLLLVGSLCVALYPLAFYTAMRWSGVAIGTLVSIASAPLFAVLMERLISQKPVSRQWQLSFGLGAFGMLLLALGQGSGTGPDLSTFEYHAGIGLGLIAGLTYAGYSYAAKRLINSGVTSASAMAAMFGLAATLLLPSLILTGGALFISVSNASIAVYMAVVPMFIGYRLFGIGLRSVDASTATLITLIEPVVAAVLAVVIIGEHLQPVAWLGMVLVIGCLLLQSLAVKTTNSNGAVAE